MIEYNVLIKWGKHNKMFTELRGSVQSNRLG